MSFSKQTVQKSEQSNMAAGNHIRGLAERVVTGVISEDRPATRASPGVANTVPSLSTPLHVAATFPPHFIRQSSEHISGS